MPQLHPADVATLGILGVIATTLAAAVLAGEALGGELVLHLALAGGYGGLALRLAGPRPPARAAVLRGLAVIAVMFSLYATLGRIAFRAIPWLADAALAQADRALLLGRAPALVAEAWASPGMVEAFSFAYAAYIPVLYMSLLLGLAGRPDAERDEFVAGFAVLYALSFLGYLFLPARGPIVELADAFRAPLEGGFFHGLVTRSIETTGGPHGAFPSLHIGATGYACLFDLRHGNRLRGLIYLPLLGAIACATVVLRYHYVVDLAAGLLLAEAARRVAAAWVARERTAARGRAAFGHVATGRAA